jgi:hypothetical protein
MSHPAGRGGPASIRPEKNVSMRLPATHWIGPTQDGFIDQCEFAI